MRNSPLPPCERFARPRLAVFFALLLLLLAPLATVLAQQQQRKPYTPRPGSRERTAILDALRPPVQKALEQKVIFEVARLKVQNGWAFVMGVPRQPNGRPVDYRKTRYQQAIKDGVFDDGVMALLRKRGNRWRVVTYALGSTDYPADAWDEEFKAPAALFR